MIEQALRIQDELIHWRRGFHMHPELGFQEFKTSTKIAELLASYGYRVRTGVGKTGVVGELGEGKPIIALRADMDALPINEENTVPYASKVEGVMHACGHDAHSAMLLGVANMLSEVELKGTLRLLFQPSEEWEDEEGLSGATRMVNDGAMEGVDKILALHVDPDLGVGQIGMSSGLFSAGVDTLYIQIKGMGGHAARPHELVDPIYLSGYAILAIHGIVSRRVDPNSPAVITIGSIHGGKTDNVVPNEVELLGTMRYRDPNLQDQLHDEIKSALEVTRSLGGDYKLRIARGCPPGVNDVGVVEVVKETGIALLGEKAIHTPEPEMGAEDFAIMCELAPGAMFHLGCRIDGDKRLAHNSRFDIDESCLPIGAGILAQTSLTLMNRATYQ